MGEEGEKPADPVACAISVMLLGSIGFQMLLYYLVNCKDTDIKKYSWQVISQTISIFCAVLCFQAINGLVEEYVLGGAEEGEMVIIVSMTQLVSWLTILQVVLAIASGAMNELIGEPPEMEEVELNLKSYAVLLAHITGFAAINAWGSLQQNIFKETPGRAFYVVPIGLFGLFIMYSGFNVIRDWYAKSDDGEIDEYEEKWDDETKESENDIAGLSLAFLTVQALRFRIGGNLPNQEGIEEGDLAAMHGGWQWRYLCGLGMVFFIGAILVVSLEERFEHQIHHLAKSKKDRLERIIEIANNYFTFAFSWCLFFGSKWAVTAAVWGTTQEVALIAVILALFLSTVSFSFIWVLDQLMDREVFGDNSERAGEAVDKMITGLGILIGFSWEQCFDTAVTVIAEGKAEEYLPKAVTKCLLSFVLVMIVFPAWRMYVLPSEQALSSDATAEKIKLRAAAGHLHGFFLNGEHEEHILDEAHLKMKEYRREAFNKPHPRDYAPSLKHLKVTSRGIVAVPPKKQGHHKKSQHMKPEDLTEHLLFDHLHEHKHHHAEEKA